MPSFRGFLIAKPLSLMQPILDAGQKGHVVCRIVFWKDAPVLRAQKMGDAIE